MTFSVTQTIVQLNSDSNWYKAIIFTAFVSLVGFVLSKIINFALRLREKIYEVQDQLIYYSREITAPGVMKEEKIRQAEDELRRLSTSLRAAADAVILYPIFKPILPPKGNIKEACRLLIGLHNSLRPLRDELTQEIGSQNRKNYLKIGSLLGISLKDE